MAYKIVEFSDYCHKCKYEKFSESEDPCWDCLGNPVNEDTHRPVSFEEKEEKK